MSCCPRRTRGSSDRTSTWTCSPTWWSARVRTLAHLGRGDAWRGPAGPAAGRQRRRVDGGGGRGRGRGRARDARHRRRVAVAARCWCWPARATTAATAWSPRDTWRRTASGAWSCSRRPTDGLRPPMRSPTGTGSMAWSDIDRIHAATSREVRLLLNGIERAGLVIDALLGTGVRGALRDPIVAGVEVCLRAHAHGRAGAGGRHADIGRPEQRGALRPGGPGGCHGHLPPTQDRACWVATPPGSRDGCWSRPSASRSTRTGHDRHAAPGARPGRAAADGRRRGCRAGAERAQWRWSRAWTGLFASAPVLIIAMVAVSGLVLWRVARRPR